MELELVREEVGKVLEEVEEAEGVPLALLPVLLVEVDDRDLVLGRNLCTLAPLAPG